MRRHRLMCEFPCYKLRQSSLGFGPTGEERVSADLSIDFAPSSSAATTVSPSHPSHHHFSMLHQFQAQTLNSVMVSGFMLHMPITRVYQTPCVPSLVTCTSYAQHAPSPKVKKLHTSISLPNTIFLRDRKSIKLHGTSSVTAISA